MREKYITIGSMNVRAEPSSKATLKRTYAANTEVIVVDKKTLSSGSIWFQIENIGEWICYYGSASKTYYMKFIENLETPDTGGETDPGGGEGESSSNQSSGYERYRVITTDLIKRSEPSVDAGTDTGLRFAYGEEVVVIEKKEDSEGSTWGKVFTGIDENAIKINNSKPTTDMQYTSVIGTLEVIKDTPISSIGELDLVMRQLQFSVGITAGVTIATAGSKYNVVRDKYSIGAGTPMYRLESALFITASPDYVKYTPINSDDTGGSSSEALPFIGYVTVKGSTVVWRSTPSWKDSAKAGIVTKGTVLKALEIVDPVDGGKTKLYRFTSDKIPDGYITTNTTYVSFKEYTPDDNTQEASISAQDDSQDNSGENTENSSGEAKVTGTITVIHQNGVVLRKKLSWEPEAKSDVYKKCGDKLYAVSDKIEVKGSYMYKLIDGLYVTANKDYITFMPANAVIWGCIYYKPKNEQLMMLISETDSDFKEPSVSKLYRVTATSVHQRYGPSENDSDNGKYYYDGDIIEVIDTANDDYGNIWVKTTDGVWACYYYAQNQEYYMELSSTQVRENGTGKVIVEGLRIRSEPNVESTILGFLTINQEITYSKTTTDTNGRKWVLLTGSVNGWACAIEYTGKVYIELHGNGFTDATQEGDKFSDDSSFGKRPNFDNLTTYDPYEKNDNTTYGVTYVPTEEDWHNPHKLDVFSDRTYPRKSTDMGVISYDYAMNTDVGDADVKKSVKQMLNVIHKEINYPFAYDRSMLGQLHHQYFNRFKITHPDYLVKQLIPVIFITRPDLNLFQTASVAEPKAQVDNDPVLSYLIRSCPQTMSSLSKNYIYGSDHKFNPLLSNLCESIDVVDEFVDVFETGETFTGYKTAYAKSNVKSMASGQVSVKFKETFDLSVTKLIQAWVRYESCVYRGELAPDSKYIYSKIIDYCCNIYYFLLDPDMETIRFWTKYIGAFPVNVSKSIFNGDMSLATGINTSEVTTSFQYFKKKDFDVTSLVEFNIDAGGVSNVKENLFNEKTGLSGRTWVGTPFITSDTIKGIGGMNVDRFKLQWRPSPNMEPNI